MLHDPKWGQPTDVFALQSLIAWLEKKPAQMAYDYRCNGECVLAQYFTDAGFVNVNVGARDFDHGYNRQFMARLPEGWNDIAAGHPRTFGGALERARAVE